MRLRELEKRDAAFMLEWMHDPSVVKDLQADFAAKTIEDCKEFIESARDFTSNLHLAVVNDNNIYIGTVSLKHIQKDTAEFGITIRTVGMGKGYSKYAMQEIIKYGFEKLGLKSIFWCVSPNNTRAIRFYDKNNYQKVDMKGNYIEGYTSQQIDRYIWYQIKNE